MESARTQLGCWDYTHFTLQDCGRRVRNVVCAAAIIVAFLLGPFSNAQTTASLGDDSRSARATADNSPAMVPGAHDGRNSRNAEDKSAHTSPSHISGTPQAKYDVERIGARGIGKGLNMYSLERERELGSELAAEIDADTPVVRDEVVVEYVNRIAQTLVAHSDATVPFTVKVVDSDEVNAFSLPGGFLYVNTGLLLAADTEAELASVLGHEIAHVAARHATKNLTRKQLFSLAAIPLSLIGGGAAVAVSQGINVAEPLSLLKFGRNAEREADLLGLQYAYDAGYDPTEFLRFFESFAKRSREKKASFLMRMMASHPATDDRVRRTQAQIANMLPAKGEYVITTSEFEAVKARLLSRKSSERAGGISEPTLRDRTRRNSGEPQTVSGPAPD